MKVILENLGVLKHAEFELGDLTVICGKNNTGKTYASHALYGFLFGWRGFLSPYNEREVRHEVEGIVDRGGWQSGKDRLFGKYLTELAKNGSCEINIQEYIKENRQTELYGFCKRYDDLLWHVFAASKDNLIDSRFAIELDENQRILNQKFDRTITMGSRDFIQMAKKSGSPLLKIVFLRESEKIRKKNKGDMEKMLAMVRFRIYWALLDIIYSGDFPNAFVISTERTGATIFKNELDFARSRIVEELDSTSDDEDQSSLLEKTISRYPLAVRENIDYIRGLDLEAKKQSFLSGSKSNEYNDILQDLKKITEGDYVVDKVTGEPIFIPHNSKKRFKMGESSSSVRALAILYFYLFHTAQKGDLLIFDEPELNLHPEKQRRLARLFARLVNVGIKVFITTHSDYIIGELNNLIKMDAKNLSAIKKIEKDQPYKLTELLNFSKGKKDGLNIKAYVAEEQALKIKEKSRKVKGYTLNEIEIKGNRGIAIGTFDSTINMINNIQDEIRWGSKKA